MPYLPLAPTQPFMRDARPPETKSDVMFTKRHIQDCWFVDGLFGGGTLGCLEKGHGVSEGGRVGCSETDSFIH